MRTLLTVTEAARLLGVHRDTVYRWAEEGRLTPIKDATKARKIGTYFDEGEVRRLADRHSKAQASKGTIRRRHSSRMDFLADKITMAERHCEDFALLTPDVSPDGWRQVLDVLAKWWCGRTLHELVQAGPACKREEMGETE